MSINYGNLFGNIGELIEAYNTLQGVYTDVDGYTTEIEAAYQGTALDDKLGSVYTHRNQVKRHIETSLIGIVNLCSEILTDRVTILEELSIGDNSSVESVLQELIVVMNDDVESVLNSTVTLGSVMDDLTNANAGTLLLDGTLDGFSSPSPGYMSHREYNGITSELAITDSMVVRCIQDSELGGTTEGSEAWSWKGGPKANTNHSWETAGSGNGPTFNTLNQYTHIANRELDSFTSNVPDNWTVVTGTAGTHILEDTAGMYHGDACLKLKGDGALAAIQLTQSISSLPENTRRCCFACYVKGDATVASGTLTIKFTGTDYTAFSTEKITMNAAALAAATGWTLKYFYINLPAEIPDDWKLDITVSGTLTNNALVRIDRIAFGPVTYFNGVNVVVVSGSDPFLIGDKFSFDTTNDDAGAFQKFFRKAYGVQLPSNASPTRANSLTTD